MGTANAGCCSWTGRTVNSVHGDLIHDEKGEHHTMIRARRVAGWRRSAAAGISILALAGCTLTTDAPHPHILGYISGDLQTTAAGTALADPLIVIIIDQYGNALSNVTVNWAVVSGGGMLSASGTPSDLNGVAQVTYTAGPTAGSATISATVAGVGTLTFTATIT